MPRRAFALVLLTAAIVPGNSLHAQSSPQTAGWETARGYKLAGRSFDFGQIGARRSDGADMAISLDPSLFGNREPFGPSWYWQGGRDGPVLAFESLGSSRRGRPRLVHVALDWQF